MRLARVGEVKEAVGWSFGVQRLMVEVVAMSGLS